MSAHPEASIVGLVTQTVAILLVATLSYVVMRSVRRVYLHYWTAAWGALALALCALLAAFRFPALTPALQPVYLLGEYAFGFMFVAGCRNFSGQHRLTRKDLWLLPAGLGAALFLGALTRGNFATLFVPHSLLVGYFFLAAYRVMRRRKGAPLPTPGIRVMKVALALLAVNFFHYAPLFAYAAAAQAQWPRRYLQYSSLYDLVLEVLLGFGAIMAVMEGVARELEWSNLELLRARDRLEALARIDPLTETLNRHGLNSFMERCALDDSTQAYGCVAIIDMDDLKLINDTCGHSVGDAAICAVARAIRSVIRKEDVLFRWGGDEFLVVLAGAAPAEADRRLQGLTETLARTRLESCSTPVRLSVSYGVAAFSETLPLHAAIQHADQTMYGQKQARRGLRQAMAT